MSDIGLQQSLVQKASEQTQLQKTSDQDPNNFTSDISKGISWKSPDAAEANSSFGKHTLNSSDTLVEVDPHSQKK